MLDGKKGLAQRIFYNAIDRASAKLGKEPMEVLEGALKNIMPVVETRSRRVGGATYQVPMEVRPERRQALGIRWLVNFARARGERTMEERLAAELVDAYQQHRRCGEEEGRGSPDGRGQQALRALSLVAV